MLQFNLQVALKTAIDNKLVSWPWDKDWRSLDVIVHVTPSSAQFVDESWEVDRVTTVKKGPPVPIGGWPTGYWYTCVETDFRTTVGSSIGSTELVGCRWRRR
jgi:hypothetical protein